MDKSDKIMAIIIIYTPLAMLLILILPKELIFIPVLIEFFLGVLLVLELIKWRREFNSRFY